MTPPASPPRDRIELRSPTRADADPILRILRDREAADLGRIDVTLGDVLEELDRIGDRFDARVAGRLGVIVGYGAVRPEGGYCSVDRANEDDERILAALLSFCEQHERTDRREVHRQWVHGGGARAQAALLARGYTLARSYHELAITLRGATGLVADPEPPGLMIEPLDPERDAGDLHRIDDAAFRERDDYVPETLTEFVRGHLGSADLAPLSRVARRDRHVVGFALVHDRPEVGTAHVRLLAVTPEDQGGGIGRRLLVDIFAAAQDEGRAVVTLHVASDNPRARRFYERLGMRERSRADVMERPIDDA